MQRTSMSQARGAESGRSAFRARLRKQPAGVVSAADASPSTSRTVQVPSRCAWRTSRPPTLANQRWRCTRPAVPRRRSSRLRTRCEQHTRQVVSHASAWSCSCRSLGPQVGGDCTQWCLPACLLRGRQQLITSVGVQGGGVLMMTGMTAPIRFCSWLRQATALSIYRPAATVGVCLGRADLDDWPGGIRQQFKAAAPMVEALLKTLKQTEELSGPLKAEIWDQGDAVGAW